MLDPGMPCRRPPARSLFPTMLAGAHGVYYLATGLWPIVDIDSFLRVTGPKTDNLPTGSSSDHWLVLTVAGLITAIALALLTSVWERSLPLSIVALALSAAVSLATIDLVFVGRGVIGRIYLADAAAEGVLIVAWLAVLVAARPGLVRSCK